VIWRDKGDKTLSLKQFLVEGAKDIMAAEKRDLNAFLAYLRSVVGDPVQALLKAGLSRQVP
jgi:hypothetical protein